ncbi:hypothetical protein CYMTET_30033 [Cymbomonas tetramitiformis]|uniref:RING-type domain-containing protein n=1 Tax=Cymbomonas tetramitiformis TaxID=36881 RepID=A0AAE0FK49_9CHLO|nr:hypothetical protein CYMTET_30033 [Cymbomonas tetramitiformis]
MGLRHGPSVLACVICLAAWACVIAPSVLTCVIGPSMLACVILAFRVGLRHWAFPDPLIRLHTLHHLSNLLESRVVPGAAPTLRDGELEAQAEVIRKQYRAASETNLLATQQALKEASQQVEKHRAELQQEGGLEWWADALVVIEQRSGRAFLDQVLQALTPVQYASGKAVNPLWQGEAVRFDSVRGMMRVMMKDLEGAVEARSRLLERSRALAAMRSAADVRRAATCADCRQEGMGVLGVRCQFCEADHDVFAVVESQLSGRVASMRGFQGGYRIDGEEAVVDSRSGLTQPLTAEFVLKQAGRAVPEHHAAAQHHTHMLEAMRREFTAARAVMNAQRYAMYAEDELEQALIRMSLRDPTQEYSAHADLYCLSEVEVVESSIRNSNDKMVALAELRKLTGTVRYLKVPPPHEHFSAEAGGGAAGLQAAAGEGPSGAASGQPQSAPSSQRAAAGKAAEASSACVDQVGTDAAGPPSGGGGARRCLLPEPPALGAAASALSTSRGPVQLPVRPERAGAGAPGDGAGGVREPDTGEERCPVCLEGLGERVVVLPCGHLLCPTCMERMESRLPGYRKGAAVGGSPQTPSYLACPTCKRKASLVDIALATTRSSNATGRGEDPEASARQGVGIPELKGAVEGDGAIEERLRADASLHLSSAEDYGTKLGAVVRRLLLLLQDPTVSSPAPRGPLPTATSGPAATSEG